MKNKTAIIVFVIILVIIALWIAGVGRGTWQNQSVNTVTPPPASTTAALCYYVSTPTARGLYDRAWLRLNISDMNATGEFRNYPAEKDSKVGTFEGTVTPGPGDRIASLWWDSVAEGMNNKEELSIKFNETSARAAFAQVVDRGDGVYVYKDKSNLSYNSMEMKSIPCTSLDEILAVEKYIRTNITTIAPNKPVLGGTWGVVSVAVDPDTDSATVVYEDGHIQSTATVAYIYDASSGSVTVTAFTVKKK